MKQFKQYLQTYTPTQLYCLLAILLILAIGCENQGKGVVKLQPDTTKVDTTAWITDHSEIKLNDEK